MPLSISEEPFGPYGGMAGDGARKLLGAPPLSPLRTLIREAGQNSWDARLGASRVRFEVRLRRLTAEQAVVLRTQVFNELPRSPVSLAQLNAALADDAPLLLEISDFGTQGLGGPTRADFAADLGESQRFVNFVRNIGVARNTPQGGGTYGFGKTSFYKASACSTVLVDTLAVSNGEPERRFIACHLGGEFADDTGLRFTGRHWWGAPTSQQGFVDPLTGDPATDLSQRLGMPGRVSGDTGTTISVLMPQIDGIDAAVAEIREALLWFFWPKMVEVDGEPTAMEFAIFAEGSEVAIPDPRTFSPLEHYVDAFLQVKRKGPESRVIKCGNPIKDLGRLAISRGFREDRRMLGPDSLVPTASHHIALMRPVELVVRYLEGERLIQGSHEWGGVFICSDEGEVERAFAASEPPAHDDWCPTNLEERRPKTFVNVALRRIREVANQIIYPRSNPAGSAPDQPPLAKAASLLGSLVPLAPEDRSGRTGRTQSGRRRRWIVQPARFISIAGVTGGVEALFQVVASNASAAPLRVTANPGLIIDDRVSGEVELPDGGTVAVVGWERDDGSAVSERADVEIAAGASVDLRVRVMVPGFGAVGLLLEVED